MSLQAQPVIGPYRANAKPHLEGGVAHYSCNQEETLEIPMPDFCACTSFTTCYNKTNKGLYVRLIKGGV